MKEKYGWFFHLRGVLMVPPVAFVTLCFWGNVENNWVILPVGGVVFLAGLVIRIWAQMHLHYRLKIKKVLTQSGPYVYVRNPIYVANTLILLGICIMTGVVWFVPIMLIYCAAVYAFVVRCEEAHLLKKFNDDDQYQEYLENVPRWMPHLRFTAKSKVFEAKRFLFASIIAEVHCLLLLIPVVLKKTLLVGWSIW